jgi:hypothetical protein
MLVLGVSIRPYISLSSDFAWADPPHLLLIIIPKFPLRASVLPSPCLRIWR